MSDINKLAVADGRHARLDVPELDRLNYFHGQSLGARDFRAEQRFFVELDRLHNRFLHGHGVVCGLIVDAPDDAERHPPPIFPGGRTRPSPDEPCNRGLVTITPGLAFDPKGNPLPLRCRVTVDPAAWLSDDDFESVCDKPQTVYLSLVYQENHLEPTKPRREDLCGPAPRDHHARTRLGVSFQASLTKPEVPCLCDPCAPWPDGAFNGVLLAGIDDYEPFESVDRDQIHNDDRRPFGLHVPTRVASVNWRLGETMTRHEAERLLRDGLRIEFTAPIRSDSIRRGLVDVSLIEEGPHGHRDRPAPVCQLPGQLHHHEIGLGFTRAVTFRSLSEFCLNEGDRVFVVARTAFLLDRCCRPVDGLNVGGRVPLTAEQRQPSEIGLPDCGVPPAGFGPWSSGYGPGSFESWFYVSPREHGHHGQDHEHEQKLHHGHPPGQEPSRVS